MALSTNDPTKLAVAIFDNAGNVVVTGKIGELTATITGLKPSSAEPAGQYTCAYSDGKNYGPRVPLEAFETLATDSNVSSSTGTAKTGTATAK